MSETVTQQSVVLYLESLRRINNLTLRSFESLIDKAKQIPGLCEDPEVNEWFAFLKGDINEVKCCSCELQEHIEMFFNKDEPEQRNDSDDPLFDLTSAYLKSCADLLNDNESIKFTLVASEDGKESRTIESVIA